MPGLADDGFAKSVVYMCEHTAQGALGFVINKPSDITLKHVFDKADMSLRREDLAKAFVFEGGPLQTERGFILHDRLTPDASISYESSLPISGGLEMTTSKDVLEALSNGAGPRRVFFSLGYASWSRGQLEREIAENSWLTVEADVDLIFNTPPAQRYDKALKLLGLERWMISAEVGHA